jgi:hypothetical protein
MSATSNTPAWVLIDSIECRFFSFAIDYPPSHRNQSRANSCLFEPIWMPASVRRPPAKIFAGIGAGDLQKGVTGLNGGDTAVSSCAKAAARQSSTGGKAR